MSPPNPAGISGNAAPAERSGMNSRVRVGLAIVGAVILLAGVVYGIRWFVHGRYIISTNDAYLRADLVTVAPRVSGYIDEIYVSENQTVAAGQPLLRIDTRNYRDSLSQQNAVVDARLADIGAAESQIRQQEAVLAQDRAQLEGAQANAHFARDQAERYRTLHDQGAETEERYAQAVNERAQTTATQTAAAAGVTVAERQLGTLKSQLDQAKAQLESARASASTAQLNLDDTLVRASIAGVIGDDTARIGQYTQPGTRLMSIVPVQGVYVVGNFKETQLQRMRIGEPAIIKVDALGGAEIHGKVASFAPGTGSQFALLPPENATGNFIKIVQRVPVRLTLMPPKELAERLIPGLSATVDIDTTHDSQSTP
jgi:membrane fusion protein, multidrug efflux system